MGLAIEVGYLADLLVNDEEGAESFRQDMEDLNEYLVSAGLPAHHEPEQCKVFSCGMYGYSGVHYLRRIAAHLDRRGVLPEPGGEGSSQDRVLEEYCRLPRARAFDHLIMHSDAEGYYLPQDFPSVLFPPDRFQIPGGMIGSSARLHDECRRLAVALELPLDLDSEAEEVWHATESQGKGDLRWKRYGIESFICLRLYVASQRSLKEGAAIVFC